MHLSKISIYLRYLSIYLIYSEQKVSNFTSEWASDALQLSCTYLPVCEVRTRKNIILQKVGDISLPKFVITGNNKVLTSELTGINIRDWWFLAVFQKG